MDMALVNTIALLLAAAAMIWAALSDAARFRIPNLACLTILLLYPVYAATMAGELLWIGNVATFAVLLGVGYILFLKNLAGAGDIKLLSVIGLWAGASHWFEFLMITAIAGGILSLGILGMARVRQRLSKKPAPKTQALPPVPYGIAIVIGGLCTLALLSHPNLSLVRG